MVRNLLLLGALAALVPACGGGSGSSDERLLIATTVAPLTSIVAGIAGDRADVRGIVPEGTNSHTFEPKPSAAELLSEADVVYVNGLKLEEPTTELAADAGADIVELGTEVLPEDEWIFDFSFPEDQGKPNPHLWTDPNYAVQYARVVADDLSERDPEGADAYEENLREFESIVDGLDTAMRASFGTIPPEDRKLLTYHDAYAYFAESYGFDVIGAVQVSDFDEPSAKELAELIEQVEAEGVPAIFGSEVFPSPVLEQIGREADVRYVDVLRDDDLPGKPGDAEHSWLGLMRFDYRTITEALGGDPTPLDDLELRLPVPDTARYPQ